MTMGTLPTPILDFARFVGANIEAGPLAGRILLNWPKREIGL
jgi:hypothetical protein